MEQKTIARMTGYKATDADMKCRDFEFEIGKWYEVEGELEMCANGFHFCQQPSGPWAYYTQKGTRVWKIEAEEVLDLPFAPGADYKYVARRIRFVVEVIATGYSNTGDSNTGYSNTGNSNTGNSNTGNSNTGYSNTGDRNTGDSKHRIQQHRRQQHRRQQHRRQQHRIQQHRRQQHRRQKHRRQKHRIQQHRRR